MRHGRVPEGRRDGQPQRDCEQRIGDPVKPIGRCPYAGAGIVDAEPNAGFDLADAVAGKMDFGDRGGIGAQDVSLCVLAVIAGADIDVVDVA
jgi:hypothetical protein